MFKQTISENLIGPPKGTVVIIIMLAVVPLHQVVVVVEAAKLESRVPKVKVSIERQRESALNCDE